jgi:hypothetical protein
VQTFKTAELTKVEAYAIIANVGDQNLCPPRPWPQAGSPHLPFVSIIAIALSIYLKLNKKDRDTLSDRGSHDQEAQSETI